MQPVQFGTPFLTDLQLREAVNYLLENMGSGGGGGSSATPSFPNSYTLFEDFLNGGVGSGPTERTLSATGAVLQQTYTNASNSVEIDPATVVGALSLNVLNASSNGGWGLFRLHPNNTSLMHSMLNKGFKVEYRFYVSDLTNPTTRTGTFGWFHDNVSGTPNFDENGINNGYFGVLVSGLEIYVVSRERDGTIVFKDKLADLSSNVPYILTIDTTGNECVFSLNTGLPDARTLVSSTSKPKWTGFNLWSGNLTYPFRIGATAAEKIAFGAGFAHSAPSPQLSNVTRMLGLDSFFLHVPKLR